MPIRRRQQRHGVDRRVQTHRDLVVPTDLMCAPRRSTIALVEVRATPALLDRGATTSPAVTEPNSLPLSAPALTASDAEAQGLDRLLQLVGVVGVANRLGVLADRISLA